MSHLSRFVQVTITSTPQMPSQVGFGTPLVFGYHTLYPDKVRTYSNLDEAVADGLTSTGVGAGAYWAMAACFAQNPRPEQVKLGRRDTAFSQSLRIVPTTAVAGAIISFEIRALGDEWHTITREVPGSSTVADEIDALKIAIDALNLDITTTDNTTSLDIDADNDGELFDIRNRKNLTLADRTALPSGMVDDLAAVVAADSDWYGLGLDSNSEAEIAAIAEKIETYEKVFFTGNADSAVVSSATDDVLSDLQDQGYFRTAFFFNGRHLLSYTGIAAMAENFPYPPGSSSYAYKTLAGVTNDVLSSTEIDYVLNKGGNVYIEVARTKNTFKGLMPSGEWIDTVIGRDWLKAREEESVFGALRGARKIPYTDNGVDLIKAAVRAPLAAGVRNGFLAATPAYTVTAPKVADVDIADRQNRHFPDIKFQATLAGAIITAALSGTISV